MILSKDQTGRLVTLVQTPRRIVSLVPSQTELLYELGLEHEVTGITKFCVHPKHWLTSKTSVGGTKTLNIEIIKRLSPDLIIANKEENNKTQIETLAKDYPVWISDISTLDESFEMIMKIGEMTDLILQAKKLITTINEHFLQLQPLKQSLKTCYLIWKDPYMTVGGDTFIHHLMQKCGLENLFENKQRYPTIRIDELIEMKCQLILLSSEPFPFKEKHIADLQKKMPESRILLVDGEIFSWYGSRLKLAPGYLNELLQSIKI